MKCIDRLLQYKDEDFDRIILYIKKGNIKCGRYSHLVKVDKKASKIRKELFGDEKSDD